MSSPWRPEITSFPSVPARVSGPGVPRIVTGWPAQVGGAGGLAIVVTSVSRLLLGLGSVTSLATEAELLISPLFFLTVALIVIVRSTVVVTVPRSQTCFPPVLLQLPAEGVAETKLTPPGSPSVTTVLVAGSGPALWTLIV